MERRCAPQAAGTLTSAQLKTSDNECVIRQGLHFCVVRDQILILTMVIGGLKSAISMVRAARDFFNDFDIFALEDKKNRW